VTAVEEPAPSPCFTYDNRTGRRPGRVVRAMSAVLPAAADVCSQVEPSAKAWCAHNVDTLLRPGRRWVVLGDSMSQSIGASAYDPAGSGSWPPAWPPLVTPSGSSTCPRPAHG